MTPFGIRGGPQVILIVREVMFDNKSILGGDIGPMLVKMISILLLNYNY